MSKKTNDVTLRIEVFDDGNVELLLTDAINGTVEIAKFDTKVDPRLNMTLQLIVQRLDQFNWKVSSERG